MNYLKGSLQSSSLSKQLLWLVMVIVLSAVFVFLIGMAFGYIFYGSDILDTSNYTNLENTTSIGMLKYTQTITHIGLFLVPSFIFSFFLFQRPVSFYQIKRKPALRNMFIAIILPVISLPLTYWLFEINGQIDLPAIFDDLEKWIHIKEEEAEVFLEAFLADRSIKALFVNLFILALIPAFGEELLFRGILQNLFTKATKRMHFSVWLTAFLFSAMHMQFLGFLPRMFLGVLLGYLFAYGKNIWLPIIMHFVNNASAVIAAYFLGSQVLGNENELFGHQNDTILIASSLLCCVFLIFTISYKNKKPLNKIA